MPGFATPEPISVTVELGMGDVRIIATDRTDTVVEVQPRDDSKAADIRAAEQTRVEYSSGRLLVRRPRQRGFLGKNSAVDVTVELPTGSDVHGDTGLGDFGCVGRLAECRLKTAMGNIRLEHAGVLHLRTSFGSIAVDRGEGDADITTGSGEVRVGEIHGAAVVKNSNGDTSVGEVTGDLRVKAANGDIVVGRAEASVIAKTANGSIRIGEVIRGTIVMETAAGALEVGIREGSAAWLDVSSQYGRVRSSLDETISPEQSEVTVEVRARTSVGDITIRRSTETTLKGSTNS